MKKRQTIAWLSVICVVIAGCGLMWCLPQRNHGPGEQASGEGGKFNSVSNDVGHRSRRLVEEQDRRPMQKPANDVNGTKTNFVNARQHDAMMSNVVDKVEILLKEASTFKNPLSVFRSGMEALYRTSELGRLYATWGNEIRRLETRAAQGDSGALASIIAIAGNADAPLAQRDTAFSSLVRLGTPDALIAVAQQLMSDDRAVRCRAFYTLPDNMQSESCNWNMPPSEESRIVVDELIRKIRNGELKPEPRESELKKRSRAARKIVPIQSSGAGSESVFSGQRMQQNQVITISSRSSGSNVAFRPISPNGKMLMNQKELGSGLNIRQVA